MGMVNSRGGRVKKLAYQMTDSDIQKEINEINDRLAGMSLGYSDRWNSERDQIIQRKAVLMNVLAYRERLGVTP